MYNDITEEVIYFLEGEGVGTAGVDLFPERLPSKPDKALMVESTGGFESDMKHGYTYATFRLLARSGEGADPRPAKTMLADAYDVLHGFGSGRLVEDGIWVISIQAVQGAPVNIDRDDNNRHRFSQNYQMEYRHVTSHRE